MNFASTAKTLLLSLLGTGIAPAVQASVVLDVRPVQPILEASDHRQRTTVRISLEGQAPTRESDRSPVNLVLVLDRSGSMQGEKISNLRRAALEVVDLMGPQDVLSVVAYDTREEVLVSAMPLRDKETVRRRINSIHADGSTALFAGVSKGLAQARIYKGGGRSTRVVLLSDGQANIGPSSPSELAALGRSAAKEGIPVTTVGLGLGYNEDLMQQLAQASDGNHDFAAEPTDLARIFRRELGEAQEIVATGIELRLTCPAGVRPLRVIDQDGEIAGQDLTIRWNQISGGQKRFALVELEVPPGAEGSVSRLGGVRAVLRERDGVARTLEGKADIAFSRSRERVASSLDRKVKADEVRALANEAERKAVEYRDAGNAPAAQALLQSNAQKLTEASVLLDDASLRKDAEATRGVADSLADESSWSSLRKGMKSSQHKKSSQRSW